MTRLSIDFETRSQADLKKLGGYDYARHPTTDVLCLAYAFDDEEPEIWLPGQPYPPRIFDHVLEGGELHAWNAAFERRIWQFVMGPRYGWPVPELEQYHCTMAASFAMALPGALEKAAPAIGLDIEKDAAGHRLMLQMCKPRKIKVCEACKGVAIPGCECTLCEDSGKEVIWWDDPERLSRLCEYCKQDVIVERAIGKRLLPLRPQEREIWLLDQRINDRGVKIDRQLCEAAKRVVGSSVKRLSAELCELTGGAVVSVTAVAALVAWLRAQGVDTDSVAKDVLEDLLIRDDIPDQARRALEIRQEGGKASVAKIDSMLTRSAQDGRMRDSLQYHGANTGRWAARGAQLQNLPRPSEKHPEACIAALLTGDADLVELMFGQPMQRVVDNIRSMITV